MAVMKKRSMAGTNIPPVENQWAEIVPPQQVVTIQEARQVSGYVLHLRFSDGHEANVDFAPFLRASQHPDVRKYLDHEQFARYTLTHGSLMWGDFEMLFPLDDLYQGRV